MTIFNQIAHEKKNNTFEDAIRKFLAEAEPGKTYEADKLTEYGIPSNVKKIVKSFSVVDNSTIEVKWKNKIAIAAIELMSAARFKDGLIKIEYLQYSKSGKTLLGISGGALGLKQDKITYQKIYLKDNNVSYDPQFKEYWTLDD